jgi:hypothetical protein
VRDHWQAGVALVYGEIAELLTRVEKLCEDVPNLVSAGTRDLNTSIIAIVKATKGAQAVIDSLGAAQEKRIAEVGAHERQQLEAKVLEALDALHARPTPKFRWWVVTLAVTGLFFVAAAGAYVGVALAR